MAATQTQTNRYGTTARLRKLLAHLFRPTDLTHAEAEAIGRGFHVILLPTVQSASRKYTWQPRRSVVE